MRDKIENMGIDEFYHLCNRLVVEMGFKVRNSVYRDDTVVFDAYMPVPGKSLHYVIIFVKRDKLTREEVQELVDLETVEIRWMLITTGKFEGVDDLKGREDLTLMDWNDFERLLVEFGLQEQLTRKYRGKEAREGRFLPSAGELSSMLQWARDFLESGNYEKALEYVNNALHIKPTPEGRKLKARILGAMGRIEEAEEILTSLLESDIRDDEAWFILGQLLEEDGDYNEAGEAYSQCVRFNSRNLACWVNRGNVMLSLEKYSEALLCYEKALEIRRDLPSLWNNRGVALKYLGKYDEALRSYNAALKIDAKFPDAYLNKAHLYFDLKRYEEARNAVMEYLRLRRDSPGLILLARIYLRRGMKKDARAVLDEVLEQEPGNQEARELLDKIEGRTREVKEYGRMKEILGDEIHRLQKLASQRGIAKELKDQLEGAKEKIEKGELSSAYSDLLEILEKIHSHEVSEFLRVLRRNTSRLLEITNMDIPENIEELGHRELDILGEEAVKRATLMGNEPARQRSMHPDGFAHFLYEESRWNELKGRSSKHAYNALGLRYLRARKYELAEKNFRVAWSLDPRFREAEMNLAYVYYKRGDKRRAIALLRHLGMEKLIEKWEK